MINSFSLDCTQGLRQAVSAHEQHLPHASRIETYAGLMRILTGRITSMRYLVRLCAGMLLYVLILTPSEARADTVVITGGSLTTANALGGGFTLIGEGLALTGAVSWGPGGRTCSPCVAGQSARIWTFNSGLDIFGGPATVNGVSYSRLTYDGRLEFDGSFTVPLERLRDVTFTVPFTFNGFLAGCTESTISGCRPGYVFSTALTGQGLATIQLIGFDSGAGPWLYNIRTVTYNFQPTPVPEPATLLLLGTGLAGAVARRLRRRAASDR